MLEPVLFALNSVSVNYDQESFLLTMISGSQARNYSLSPLHAKRLSLLMQKQISEYESKFEELKTELPKNIPEQTSESKIGFAKE